LKRALAGLILLAESNWMAFDEKSRASFPGGLRVHPERNQFPSGGMQAEKGAVEDRGKIFARFRDRVWRRAAGNPGAAATAI